MGKRFTDTDKWKKTWFRKLSPEMKCVWDYLCSNCDAAGIWEVDEEAMSFFIGSTITLDEITSSFGDRIEKINGSKIWIVDFCGFQYGEIKENYNPHRPVIKSLEKYKLKSRVQQPFSKGSRTLMDKDKDKDKDQDKDKEKGSVRGKTNLISSGGLPKLAELWNQYAHQDLARVRRGSKNSTRQRKAKLRWDELPDEQHWIRVIQRISSSPGCLGTNDNGWKADFDFLIKPDTAERVLEGKYDNWGRSQGGLEQLREQFLNGGGAA